MDKNTLKSIIANRVAKELKDGDVVNLGIGIPTLVPNFLDENMDVTFQSENGFIDIGSTPKEDEEDNYIVNAGGIPVTIKNGGSFFDSCTSFGIIRGGHVDITVLGALQVDEKGNLANWMIPGKLVPGMGGAMDLVVGAKKVILAMEHTAKGKHKILKECNLPLTAKEQVDLIITEMGVIKVTKEGLVLKEINSEFSIEEVQNATQAQLIISDDLKDMDV